MNNFSTSFVKKMNKYKNNQLLFINEHFDQRAIKKSHSQYS